MRPRRRSILLRSFRRPVSMVFARRCKASSMRLEKRFRMAFSFSLRPAVRVLLGPPLYLRAGQVIQQHLELRPKQLPIALLEMPLQFRLVWQNPVQAAVQPGVVDLAFFDAQQIIECCGWIPALLDRQLAARRTQTVNRQHCRHTRPRHVGLLIIQDVLEEPVQLQTFPELQTEPATAELSGALQAHLICLRSRSLLREHPCRPATATCCPIRMAGVVISTSRRHGCLFSRAPFMACLVFSLGTFEKTCCLQKRTFPGAHCRLQSRATPTSNGVLMSMPRPTTCFSVSRI